MTWQKSETVEKRFCGEREVEALFGIGVRQLRAHRMRGDGPPWIKTSGKIGQRGGRVLYPISGVQQWLNSRPGGGERSERQVA